MHIICNYASNVVKWKRTCFGSLYRTGRNPCVFERLLRDLQQETNLWVHMLRLVCSTYHIIIYPSLRLRYEE